MSKLAGIANALAAYQQGSMAGKKQKRDEMDAELDRIDHERVREMDEKKYALELRKQDWSENEKNPMNQLRSVQSTPEYYNRNDRPEWKATDKQAKFLAYADRYGNDTALGWWSQMFPGEPPPISAGAPAPLAAQKFDWNQGMDTFNANARTQGMRDSRTGMMIQGAGMGVDPGSIPFQGEPPVFSPRSPISSMIAGGMPQPQPGIPAAQGGVPHGPPPVQRDPVQNGRLMLVPPTIESPPITDKFIADRVNRGMTPPKMRTSGGMTTGQAAGLKAKERGLNVARDEQAARKSDYEYNRQMKRDPLEDENLKLDVQIKKDRLKSQAAQAKPEPFAQYSHGNRPGKDYDADVNSARSVYQQAAKISPGSPEALTARAQLKQAQEKKAVAYAAHTIYSDIINETKQPKGRAGAIRDRVNELVELATSFGGLYGKVTTIDDNGKKKRIKITGASVAPLLRKEAKKAFGSDKYAAKFMKQFWAAKNVK